MNPYKSLGAAARGYERGYVRGIMTAEAGLRNKGPKHPTRNELLSASKEKLEELESLDITLQKEWGKGYEDWETGFHDGWINTIKKAKSEENPLATPEIISQLQARRMAEEQQATQYAQMRSRGPVTVHWIPGKDNEKMKLRIKIIKEDLMKKFGVPVQVIRTRGEKLAQRRGSRPAGWEFIALYP
jgi:hypothetical protein